jgi:hypothetical protein
MKYPASHLTPFLAPLPENLHRLHIDRSQIYPTPPKVNSSLSYCSKLFFTLSLEGFVAKKVNFFGIKQIQTLSQRTPGVGCGVPLRHLRVLRVSALSFAVLASVLVIKNLRITPSTPSICIPCVFTHLQIPFFATRVFSQTSALPPSFSLFVATRLPRAEPGAIRRFSVMLS